jgi:RNA polymerase primary sigma factor
MTKPKDAQPAHSRANGLASAAAAGTEKKSEAGASLKNHKEIKKLIDMGVQRGYLTFIEVNELLPPEIITPDAIDEVMNLLSENEIEVIETTKRP